MRNLLEDAAGFLSDPKLNGRAPGTEGHERAAGYLEARMRELEMRPLFEDGYGQDIRGRRTAMGRNLCGLCPGAGGAKILVGAHYEHFEGMPGADDNAAGVAIVLDAARRLRPWRGRADLVFCFFDLEEPPHYLQATMGSVHFVRHCPFDPADIACAIILDLCGHDVPIPGAEHVLFVTGAEHHRFLVNSVLTADSNELPLLMARNERIGDMSDHHAFRSRGVPFLFLSCGWWEHYHRPTDTFDRLNLSKMRRIAGALEALVRGLDGADLGQEDARRPPDDFDGHEARTLSRLLGVDVPPDPAALDAAASKVLDKLMWRHNPIAHFS